MLARAGLRLLRRRAVQPPDREASGRGRGLPGGRGQPAAGPRHDRPVPGRASGRDRRAVRSGAGGVRPAAGCCDPGWSRSTGPSWSPTPPGTRTGPPSRSPRRSSPRRLPPTTPTTRPPRTRPRAGPAVTIAGPGAGRSSGPAAGAAGRAGGRGGREVLRGSPGPARREGSRDRQDRSAAGGRHLGRRRTSRAAQANITDPDSRLLKTKDGYVQGYNAQAVATIDQFVVAAEVTNRPWTPRSYDADDHAPPRGTSRPPGNGAGSAGSSPTPATGASTTSTSPASSPSSPPAEPASSRRSPSRASTRRHLGSGRGRGARTRAQAAQQLGVSRARVNQLLRRRRSRWRPTRSPPP